MSFKTPINGGTAATPQEYSEDSISQQLRMLDGARLCLRGSHTALGFKDLSSSGPYLLCRGQSVFS